MRLLFYDELDSTSSQALRLYRRARDSGEELPAAWAVVAASQHEGRGRLAEGGAHAWHSPYGHLYVSFLFPCSPWPLASLQGAWLVARYLKAYMGFAPLVKWPNDILVQGRKMGGILTEALAGGDDAYLCVGVGVNVCEDPQLQRHLPSFISLAEACRRDGSPEELARGLAQDFEKYFKPESFQLTDLMPYLPSPNTLMVGDDGKQPPTYGLYQGCSDAGGLLVRSIAHRTMQQKVRQISETFEVYSAQRGYQLFFPSHHRGEVALLEVGNSRIKAYRVPTAALRCCGDYPQDDDAAQQLAREMSAVSWFHHQVEQPGGLRREWLEELQQWWQPAYPHHSSAAIRWPLYVISTDQVRSDRYRTALSEHLGCGWYDLPRKTQRLHLGPYPLQQIGMDRLCLLEGVLATCYQARSTEWCMVISWGTAMTVDFMTLAGEHLGGAIFPSSYLSMQSLASGAAALEHKDLPVGVVPLGRDTASCMQAGVAAQIRGALYDLFMQAQAGKWFQRGDFSGKIYSSGGGGQAASAVQEWCRELACFLGPHSSREMPHIALEHGEYVVLGMLSLFCAPAGTSHDDTKGLRRALDVR